MVGRAGGSTPSDDPAHNGGPAGNEPTIPLPAVDVDGKRGMQTGRQIAVFAAVGTIALLAIVSALVGSTGGDDSAAAEATEALQEACAARLVPVTEAVEEWQGIDNWAADATDSPDLGELSVAAVEELATISSTSDLAVTAVALRRQLDDQSSDATQRAEAVRTALRETADSLTAASAPDSCEIERFEAALTLG